MRTTSATNVFVVGLSFVKDATHVVTPVAHLAISAASVVFDTEMYADTEKRAPGSDPAPPHGTAAHARAGA